MDYNEAIKSEWFFSDRANITNPLVIGAVGMAIIGEDIRVAREIRKQKIKQGEIVSFPKKARTWAKEVFRRN